MAVFGAPAAHEDDPERAVRAALAIRRRGSTTSTSRTAASTRARRSSRSARGRPRARAWSSGDVVNTAARMQSAAPVERHPRRRRHVPRDAERDRVPRGGARSRRRARPSRSRSGRPSRRGRASATTSPTRRARRSSAASASSERSWTRSSASRRELAPQLVTLVGVPGIGKSRLVAELFQVVDRDPELIGWRQGRSLPVRRGPELLGARRDREGAGGNPRDGRGRRGRGKLDVAARRPRRGRGRARLDRRPRAPARRARRSRRRRRRPALGGALRLAAAARGARRAPSARPRLRGPPLGRRRAARLRRLPRRVGRRRADADPRDGAARAPRPAARLGRRQAERHDALARAARRDDETARLLGELLEQTLLPAEIQRRRCRARRGNPLYAEEFVRMLRTAAPRPARRHVAARARGRPAAAGDRARDDRGAARRAVARREGARAGRGRHRQGLLARRRRRDGRPLAVRARGAALHALERKEFIRRERRSAVAGETQYAFLHALVRDVAYGADPARPARRTSTGSRRSGSTRCRANARRTAPRCSRTTTARRSSSRGLRASTTRRLREPARQALIEATERASRLYAIAAIVDFGEAALELAGEDDPARPLLEFRLAEAYQQLGQYRFDLALSARDGFLADGDVESAALVDILLARMYWLARQHAGVGRAPRACVAARRGPAAVVREGAGVRPAGAELRRHGLVRPRARARSARAPDGRGVARRPADVTCARTRSGSRA